MLRVFRAEVMKWRRNWFPWVVLASALAAPFLVFLMGALRSDRPTAASLMQNILTFHFLLTGPLVVTLIGAQFIAAEYQWDTWKLLLTAPVPRWSVYAAKWVLGVVWIMALSLLVALAGFSAAYLVHATGALAYGLWLKAFLYGSVGLTAALSVYHLITLISRNFFVTSAVGIVAAFAGLLASQSKYIGVYPITGNLLIVQSLLGRVDDLGGVIGTPEVWAGVLIATALFGLVGSLAYVQKASYR